ncbi:filensin [Hemitrygon akajei]|uniref:filensin n=1 Tax=Hemitrygon akajei TaxID=2704970 RepID=UPI003BFA273E
MSGARDLHDVEKTKEGKTDPFSMWSGTDLAKPGLQSLEEFNIRFSRYVNRTRTFDQSNTSLGKQLESLRQVRELAGLEDVFTEQIQQNQQRIWDLHNELNCLEQELKDAQRALDDYRTKYRTECEHHEKLQDGVANLIKDTNEALLKNLELQVRTQFLKEDIDSTKERNMKNLAEIQSYMNVLKQVHQPTSYDSPATLSFEDAMQEQGARNMEGHYLDQMQSYNEQIEDLRKKTEEAETSLEMCANECRQVVIYQQSLENELERYKQFIADEDYQLESTSPLATSSQYKFGQDFPERKGASEEEKVLEKNSETGNVEDNEDKEGVWDVALDDVPDGAQISRVYDALCNVVRERMKKYRKPEVPAAEFYAKGHRVLVTGEASYTDPFFCASVPARSQVTVTYDDDHHLGTMDIQPKPDLPTPLSYNGNGDGEKGFDSTTEKDEDKVEDKEQDDEISDADREPKKQPLSPPAPPPISPQPMPEPSQISDNKPVPISGQSEPHPDPSAPDDLGSKFISSHKEQKDGAEQPRITMPTQPLPSDKKQQKEPRYKYYEKIEVIEAVETFTDNKLQGYEETATIVETTVEKANQDRKAKKL